MSIAAFNSPRNSIISGDKDAVAELVTQFQAAGVFSQLIKVDVASHSAQMEEPARELGRMLTELAPAKTELTFVSSVTGRIADGRDLSAAYWMSNLREPVRFVDALDALGRDNVKVLIEVGPHPILAPSIQQTLANATVIGCGRRGEPERNHLLAALAKAWCAGCAVDWGNKASRPARVIDVPTYPWQQRRLWVETAEIAHAQSGAASRRGPDDEARGGCIAWSGGKLRTRRRPTERCNGC